MSVPAEKGNSSKTFAPDQTHELAGIEILRFLCAMAVIIWHYQNFFFAGVVDDAQVQSFRHEQPFYGLLQYAYEGGYWAVRIFWGISGFIFYWTYAQRIFDGRTDFLTFAVRRFSRLYPLHITTLVIVALLQYVYFHSHGQDFAYNDNSLPAFIGHLFFASNWFKAQAFTFNGPIWSVSVEVLVYLAFFCIVRKAGPAPAIAFAACAVSWVLDRANTLHISPLTGEIFKCAIFFFAGGLTQWLSLQRWALPSGLFVGTVTGALLALGLIRADGIPILILTICLVAVSARIGELKLGLVARRLVFLGNATYSSYLLHFPIQLGVVIAVDAMGYSRSIFTAPSVFLTYLTLVIGLSLAVYHLFERPAQNWIRDAAGRLQRPPASRKSYS